MAMIQRAKRAIEGGDMDITPMIDCTFLLLIFFLLTSSSQKAPVKLPPAFHGAQAAEADAIIITVKRGDNGEPQVFLADGTKASAEIVGGAEDQEVGMVSPDVIEAVEAATRGEGRLGDLVFGREEADRLAVDAGLAGLADAVGVEVVPDSAAGGGAVGEVLVALGVDSGELGEAVGVVVRIVDVAVPRGDDVSVVVDSHCDLARVRVSRFSP